MRALLAICALCVLPVCRAVPRLQMEPELPSPARRGWTEVGPAHPEHLLRVVIAIKQSNIAQLQDTVLRVSDPKNADYGKHLTKAEVDALVAPPAASLAAVRRFVGNHTDLRACSESDAHDFLSCNLPVRVIEGMLQTRYARYNHTSGATAIRAERYSLPADVAAAVDFVAPTVKFPALRWAPKASQSAGARKLLFGPGPGQCGGGPTGGNTPKSIRKLYSVGDALGKGKSIQAATAFLVQHYLPSDLKTFWKQCFSDSSDMKIKVVGPNGDPAPGIEASLDIEYISTIGSGVNTEFWSFAGSPPGEPDNEPFLAWIQKVGNTSDAEVPKIFSTSYGESESSTSLTYMDRVEAEFVKAAARGISLLFATGDAGVCNHNHACPGGRFQGMWPAGSPWVTGVGGTTLGPGAAAAEFVAGDTGETAWSDSAGGFSDRWSRPKWQEDAVSSFVKGCSVDKSKYNATSRGFPDVSALATDFTVINQGFPIPVAGTSAATPTFSGVVGLLNDLRAQKGKAPLGLLNPMFYQNAAAFNDITEGQQSGGQGCEDGGFTAVKGWDPVTGLGSPNYAKLAAVVASLP